nr:reverse transcriptase domain-containing protein [Tanacetum cinerariifolium]
METTPSTREQIEGYLLALGSLLKEHNWRGNVSPIRLSFDNVEDQTRVRTVVTGKEVGDADLKRPFKEAVKTPLTRRIIEFSSLEFKMSKNIKLYDGTTDPEDHLSRFSSAANSGEWPLPVWCIMFQQTLDGSVRGWFENLSQGSINGWVELRQQFITRFLTRRISSFMDAHKCPELAKRYSDKAPKTMDEMTTRLDDFVRSETAFASMEPPKGEASYKIEDASDEPLIIKAVMEGYLVRRVYVDQGASMEVMFEHCFENLSPVIRSRIRGTQMDLVGFAGGVDGLKIPPSSFLDNTLHGKFPTPRGVTTLVTRSAIISECRRIDISQPSLSGSAGNNRGKPVGTITRCTKKKGSGIRQDLGRKQGSEGMGERKNSLSSEIPYMDIKLGALQMAQDEDTDQGMYYYTKMPFGLKNAEATYQRLVDTAFQSQIGRNLKAYVDDMVIKSNDKKVLIEDIAETFDNLWRINMKLNPKKCNRRYAIPSDIKRDAEPKWKASCIKEILVPVRRKAITLLRNSKGHDKGKQGRIPLDRKREKGVLRDENGHSRAVAANHPSKGGNIIRIHGSDNGGRKWRIASRKKGETMFDTLRKPDVEQSRKEVCPVRKTGPIIVAHVQEATEVLADFLSEAPVGIPTEEFFRLPTKLPNKDDVERWILFIDRATNNEAEYEALLAGLRMARKMKVRNIDVEVDSKLIEAKPLARITEKVVKRFVWENIMCRFGLPQIIVMDNGTQFFNDPFKGWCESLNIKQMNTAVAHPQANGLVERDNKSLMEGIKARLGTEWADWVDELPNVLWAHHTSLKQSNDETPFSLTYGSEAVIPTEIGMPTHRTMMIREDKNEDELRLRTKWNSILIKR